MTALRVLVPSRGRPAAVAGLAAAVAATAAGDTEMVAVCDADDPALEGYEALALPPCARLHVQSGARRMGPVLNAAAAAVLGRRAAAPGATTR